MDHSQGFPLCDISLSLGQFPASQHSGTKSLKMAKLWLTQPGGAGKERLEKQERGRKEVPGWGRSRGGPFGAEPPLLTINHPPLHFFLPG